jgi:hypothetical protein
MVTSVPQTWACPTCRTTLDTRFCPSCGEKPLQPNDLRMRALLSQAFTALTSVDTRVMRSFRNLIFRPGALTAAFMMGQRKPFIAALPLFLLVNLLFFAAQSISPEKVFSSPLQSHVQQQDWRELAQQLVANKLAATGTPAAEYARTFDAAVSLNAKSLVILMVVPLCFVLPLVFRSSRQPFAVHAVFALHCYAFQLLLLSALLAIVTGGNWLGAEHMVLSATVDHALFGIYLAGCATYLFLASHVVYGGSALTRMWQVATLTLIAGISVVGYRFLLFVITLAST